MCILDSSASYPTKMVPQDALAAVSNKCLRCLGRSSGKRRCAVALRRSPDATVTHDLHVHTRVSRLSSQSTEATSHCSRRKLAAARSSSVVANRISSSRLWDIAQILDVPVLDHWWQTETGWAITGNPVGLELLPVKYGSASVPMPGYEIHILDEGGHEVEGPNTLGAVAIKLPLPPGNLPTLWNNDERFQNAYLNHFPGYYETADAGFIDEDGYLHIMARTDDIINVAGHRLSTGGMEEVLSSHQSVAECAVLGIADALKGQKPIGFVVLKSGNNKPLDEIEKECIQLVREEIGAVAALRHIMVVDRLPKTRSGKILRATIRKIADGEEWKMPATIDDPAILDEITEALRSHGLLTDQAA